MLVALFATTMFVSAMLLFVVQPMIAKLLLPELGGSAAVWTTCMLFFQGMLLLGYGYAHAGARWLSPRRQVVVHTVVVLAALISLPIAIPALDIDASTSPTLWVLTALMLAVGLPFFAVSTTAPLLQHWFAHTDHPDASDPYFLYAASNIGSMVALLGYPLVIEPALGVSAQTSSWTWGFIAFVALLVTCATRVFSVRTSRAHADAAPTASASEEAALTSPYTLWLQRIRWVLLAAVPSSLMLGLTQFVTTDIAPVPLLWVLPLALYLLTFILVFAKRPVWLPNIIRTLLPISCAMIFMLNLEMWEVALHLGNFFLLTLFFHGLLAEERPEVARLTEFFLLLSVGGVLGGLFNAVIAPLLFNLHVEYRLVMVVAIACIYPAQLRVDGTSKLRHVVPILTVGVAIAYLHIEHFWWTGDKDSYIPLIMLVVIYLLVAYLKPRWENVVFAILLAIGAYSATQGDDIIGYERSYFATYKLHEEVTSQGSFRILSHGTTAHGAQALDPVSAHIPLSYYYTEGPVGHVMDTIDHGDVLVVGLGAGAIAGYASERTHFDFFEIDPLVEAIARTYFSYLEGCGKYCTVTIGDGRRLIETSSKKWDIIILDAYNSDAVPTHLMTVEAVEVYLEHLNPNGVILFHVSNRYLDLEGIVGSISTYLGLTAMTHFYYPSDELEEHNVSASHYVVVARTPEVLEPLLAFDEWEDSFDSGVMWTDDFSNLVDVLLW